MFNDLYWEKRITFWKYLLEEAISCFDYIVADSLQLVPNLVGCEWTARKSRLENCFEVAYRNGPCRFVLLLSFSSLVCSMRKFRCKKFMYDKQKLISCA